MTSRIKFLISLGNLIKNGAVKTVKQAMDFAEQQFGKIDKSFTDDIINVFKKEGKTKKGDVVPIKKQEGIVRRPEEFATRKEYERYLDETLGPSDDVFGSPMKDDLLKEWDKVKAKNVTPKDEGIPNVLTKKQKDKLDNFFDKNLKKQKKEKVEDLSTKLLKQRTEDIEYGEPMGALKDESKKIDVDRLNFIPGGSRYAEGNLRTAIRQFLRTEEKAGRIKLNETDSFRIREYSPMKEDDPIDVFRRYYGEDALDAADAMADELRFGESFKHYEEIFRKNMPDLKVKVKGAGEYDDSVKAGEQLRALDEFDPGDRQPNADGGLINILKL